MIPHTDMAVTDGSQVRAARRAALRLALEKRLDEITRGRIALVVAEPRSRWSRKKVGGTLPCAPAAIAGWLAREHTRGNDDVTVVVLEQV